MKSLRKRTTIFACVILIHALGCTKPPASTPTTKRSDVGPTYVAPSSTGTTTIDGIEYEYIATAQREAEIITGFPKLKVGQTREEVRKAVGLPDTARPGYGKASDAPFLGWEYMYKIKIRVAGPNTNDVYVEAFFNPAGELKWAIPNHIAGLKEIGGSANP